MSLAETGTSTDSDELDEELLLAEKAMAEAKAKLIKARKRKRQKQKEAEAAAATQPPETPESETPETPTTEKKRVSKKRRRKRTLKDSMGCSVSPKALKRLTNEGTRTPKTKKRQELRKLLGGVLKHQMDARLLAREFHGPGNVFDKNAFEDEVLPLLDYFESSAEIDTCKLTRYQMFMVLVDVAKKRGQYTPVEKKKATKKPAADKASASTYMQAKKNARAIYSAIVAVKNAEDNPGSPVAHASAAVAERAAKAASADGETAAFAVVTPTTTKRPRRPAPAAAAAAIDIVADDSGEDTVRELFAEAAGAAEAASKKKTVLDAVASATRNAGASPTNKDVADLFQPSSEEEGEEETLVAYNKRCLEERKAAKKTLQDKKVAIAKQKAKDQAEKLAKQAAKAEKAEKAKQARLAKRVAKAEKAKKKAELAKKKAELAKKKAELAKQAKDHKLVEKSRKKKEKAKKADAIFKRYIAGCAAEAVAASKAGCTVERNRNDCLFKIGMKVLGFWPDDSLWYPGVVVSLDYVHRTVHIRYDDNDEDTAVPWYKARILEDELGDG